METSLDICDRVEYTTTVGEMEAFLDTVEQRDNDYPSVWDKEKDAIKSAREWISRYREIIADIYAKYEVGVAYSSDEIIPGFEGFDAKVLGGGYLPQSSLSIQ